jgi:hypothetical protein
MHYKELTMQTQRVSSLFIVAVVLLLSACAPQVDWKEFSSTKGRFSVLMPGSPTADHDTEDYPGAGEIGLFSYILRAPSAEYAVIHSDFPNTFIQKMSADQFLDMARDEILLRFGGWLASEKKVMLDNKHPGRELEMTVEEEHITVLSRLYVVGQRIYYVMVAMPSTAMSVQDAARFLNSFKLR